jgi:hypothetical protein
MHQILLRLGFGKQRGDVETYTRLNRIASYAWHFSHFPYEIRQSAITLASAGNPAILANDFYDPWL